MANICLVDVDGKHFPNLALMKLSAWHKQQGDNVSWYHGMLSNPDIIYASKVFTFTTDFNQYVRDHKNKVRKSGTGYNFSVKLPYEIESCLPDLTLYDCDEAYGFLTRGCIRKCQWCIVPKKEGELTVVDDIERVCQDKKHVILMDNNFLASPEGFIQEQIDKIKRLDLRVDFNQGLDARKVNESIAKMLASIKWHPYIRFACDTDAMLEYVRNTVQLLRGYGYTKDIFVYVLAQELESALYRITKLGEMPKVVPFCMPYRNLDGDGEIVKGKGLRRLARWCNHQAIRKSVKFENYVG